MMDRMRPVPHISAPASGEWYHALITYPRSGGSSLYNGSDGRDASPQLWSSNMKSSSKLLDTYLKGSPTNSAHSFAVSSVPSTAGYNQRTPRCAQNLERSFPSTGSLHNGEREATNPSRGPDVSLNDLPFVQAPSRQQVRHVSGSSEVHKVLEERIEEHRTWQSTSQGLYHQVAPLQAEVDRLKHENAVLSERLQQAVFSKLQMERVVQDRESLSEVHAADPGHAARHMSITFLERRLKEAEASLQKAQSQVSAAEARASSAEGELLELQRLLETRHIDDSVTTAATPQPNRERGIAAHGLAMEQALQSDQQAELQALQESQQQFIAQCQSWKEENRRLMEHCMRLEQELMQALAMKEGRSSPDGGVVSKQAAEIQTLRESQKQLSAECRRLEEDNRLLQARCSRIESSLLEADNSRALDSLQSEMEILEKQLHDARLEKTDMDASRRVAVQEVIGMQDQIASLISQKEQQAAVIDELRNTLAEQLKNEQNIFRDHHRAVEQAQSAMQELKQMTDTMRSRDQQLAEAQDALEAEANRYAQKCVENDRLTEENHDLQQQVAAVRVQMMEDAKIRQTMATQFQEMRAEKQHVERLVQVLEEEVHALRSARDAATGQVSQLERDIAAMTSELQRVHTEAKDARCFAEDHEMALVDTITAKAALEDRLAALAEEGQQLRKQISLLEAELSDVQQQLRSSMQRHRADETLLQSVMQERDFLQQRNDEWAEERRLWQGVLETMQSTMSQWHVDVQSHLQADSPATSASVELQQHANAIEQLIRELQAERTERNSLTADKSLLQQQYDLLYGEWKAACSSLALLQNEVAKTNEQSAAFKDLELSLRKNITEMQVENAKSVAEAQLRLQQAEQAKRAAMMEAEEMKLQLDDLQQLFEDQNRQLDEYGEKALTVEQVNETAKKELEDMRSKLAEFEAKHHKLQLLEDQLEEEGKLRISIEQRLAEVSQSDASKKIQLEALQNQNRLLEDQLEEEGKLRTTLEDTIKQGNFGMADQCRKLQNEISGLTEKLRVERNSLSEVKRQLWEMTAERDRLEEAYQEALEKFSESQGVPEDDEGLHLGKSPCTSCDKATQYIPSVEDDIAYLTTSLTNSAREAGSLLYHAQNMDLNDSKFSEEQSALRDRLVELSSRVQELHQLEIRLSNAIFHLEVSGQEPMPSPLFGSPAHSCMTPLPPQRTQLTIRTVERTTQTECEGVENLSGADHLFDPHSRPQAEAEMASLRERIVMLTQLLKKSEKNERTLQRELALRCSPTPTAGTSGSGSGSEASTIGRQRSPGKPALRQHITPAVTRRSSHSPRPPSPHGPDLSEMSVPRPPTTPPPQGGHQRSHLADSPTTPSPLRSDLHCSAILNTSTIAVQTLSPFHGGEGVDTSSMEIRLAQLEDEVATLKDKIRQQQQQQQRLSPARGGGRHSPSSSSSPLQSSPDKRVPSPEARAPSPQQRHSRIPLSLTTSSATPGPRECSPDRRSRQSSPANERHGSIGRHAKRPSPAKAIKAHGNRPSPPVRQLERRKVQKRKFPFFGLEVADGIRFSGEGGGKQEYGGLKVIESWGPARDAGIMPLDFIVAVDGCPVTNLSAFRSKVESLEPNTSVTVLVERKRLNTCHRMQCIVQTEPTSKEPGRLVKSNIIHARLDAAGDEDAGNEGWRSVDCSMMSATTVASSPGPSVVQLIATPADHLSCPGAPQMLVPSPRRSPRPAQSNIPSLKSSPGKRPSPSRAASNASVQQTSILTSSDPRSDSISDFLSNHLILSTPTRRHDSVGTPPSVSVAATPPDVPVGSCSPVRYPLFIQENSPPPPPPPLQHCSSPPPPLAPHLSSSPPQRRAPRFSDEVSEPPALSSINPPR